MTTQADLIRRLEAELWEAREAAKREQRRAALYESELRHLCLHMGKQSPLLLQSQGSAQPAEHETESKLDVRLGFSNLTVHSLARFTPLADLAQASPDGRPGALRSAALPSPSSCPVLQDAAEQPRSSAESIHRAPLMGRQERRNARSRLQAVSSYPDLNAVSEPEPGGAAAPGGALAELPPKDGRGRGGLASLLKGLFRRHALPRRAGQGKGSDGSGGGGGGGGGGAVPSVVSMPHSPDHRAPAAAAAAAGAGFLEPSSGHSSPLLPDAAAGLPPLGGEGWGQASSSSETAQALLVGRPSRTSLPLHSSASSPSGLSTEVLGPGPSSERVLAHSVSGRLVADRAAGDEQGVLLSQEQWELLQLKERALHAVQEGITIADRQRPDMPLIFANDAFSRMTGYSPQESLGHNCRFLQGAGTDPTQVATLRAAIDAGRPAVAQLLNYRKNGDPFVNYLSITPIHDVHGNVTHYVGIQSDITELLRHKHGELAAKHAAVQAAVATEAKSQFLARMSHEIRTPLNGVIAVGQLLADTPLTPAQWDLVSTIRCSGETLLTLITDILDFSRIEADKMTLSYSDFRLQTVIEAAMEIAGLRAAQKRLHMAYHIAAGTPLMVQADAQRLQQILLNVLMNAVKFTEQGEILLEVWAEQVTAVPAEASDAQDSRGSGPAASAPAELEPEERPLPRCRNAPGAAADDAAVELARQDQEPAAAAAVVRGASEEEGVSGAVLPTISEQHMAAAHAGDALSNGSSISFASAPGRNADAAADSKPPQRGADSQGETGWSGGGADTACWEASASQGAAAATRPQPPPAVTTTTAGEGAKALASGAGPRSPASRLTRVSAASSDKDAGSASESPRRRAGVGVRKMRRGSHNAGVIFGTRSGSGAGASSASSHGGASGRTQRGARSAGGASGGAAGAGPRTWRVHFSVVDTGIGISSADLGRLFKSFSQVDTSPTRRYHGSGLGLAISRKLCEAMSGWMWASSPGPDCGSHFQWFITCREAAGRRKQPHMPPHLGRRPLAGQRPPAAGLAGLLGGGPSSGPAWAGASGPVRAGSDSAARNRVFSQSMPHNLLLPPPAAGATVSELRRHPSLDSTTGYLTRSAWPSSTSGSVLSRTEGSSYPIPVSEPPPPPPQQQQPLAPPAWQPYASQGSSGEDSQPFGSPASTEGFPLPAPVVAAVTGAATEPLLASAAAAPTLVPRHERQQRGAGASAGGLSVSPPSGRAADEEQRSRMPAPPVVGGSSSSGGSRRQQQRRQSSFGSSQSVASSAATTGQADLAGSNAGSPGSWGPRATTVLPVLWGCRVLLVEACFVVQQSLALALRSWGCHVAAVSTQLEALRLLQLQPGCRALLEQALGQDMAGEALLARGLSLSHAPDLEPGQLMEPGPYDVVLMDAQYTRLLQALMSAEELEAARIVFFGWPGDAEPEAPEPLPLPEPQFARHGSSGSASDSSSFEGAESLDAGTDATAGRQLGYVTVLRPIRQGRLKLALEEVLTMSLHEEEEEEEAEEEEAEQKGPEEERAEQEGVEGGELPKAAGTTALSGMQEALLPPQSLPQLAHRDADSDALGPPILAPLEAAGGSSAGTPEPAPTLSPTRPRSLLHLASERAAHEQLAAPPTSGRSLLMRSQSTSGSSLLYGLDAAVPLAAASRAGQEPAARRSEELRSSSLRPAQALRSGGRATRSFEAAGPTSLKLLLAEDNPINMKVAVATLRQMVHGEIAQVADGREALDVLEAAGGPEAFDLILMDLHMPRMDGMQCMTEVRRRWPDSAVYAVAVTADAFQDTKERCLAAGFNSWLPKPFRVEDMKSVLQDQHDFKQKRRLGPR